MRTKVLSRLLALEQKKYDAEPVLILYPDNDGGYTTQNGQHFTQEELKKYDGVGVIIDV